METHKLTVEQFWELAQHPQYDNQQLELHDGRLVTMAPSGELSSTIGGSIFVEISVFNRAHKLGVVTPADGGYRRDLDTVVAPDVGFIRHENRPADYDREKFTPAPPDLAVEVISPGNTSDAFAEKTRRYLDAGTRLVWNVYPRRRAVEVFRMEAGEVVQTTLTAEDTLSGGDVLPGFELPVAAVFD
ncbi:MAG: Uma2 family endonuclease [Anaerolineae bacterium]